MVFGFTNDEHSDIRYQYIQSVEEEWLRYSKKLLRRTLAYLIDNKGDLLSACVLIPRKFNGYPGLFIMGLTTPKSHRKKGYASLLLSHIQQETETNNIYELNLRVNDDKLHLLRPFYERNGYTYSLENGKHTFYLRNKKSAI